MSVKIRLSRVGKKHLPFYRIVVVDSRKKRDGQFLADIGTYDAIKSKLVQFDKESYDAWISKGAQASDSAKRIHELYKRHGIGVGLKKELPVKQAPKKPEPKVEAAAEKPEVQAAPKAAEQEAETAAPAAKE